MGWLDGKHQFQVEPPSEEFLESLLLLCIYPEEITVTRGYHVCDFCEKPTFGIPINYPGRNVKIGSAEIRVRGQNEIVYAAPNMIYHYVQDHHYKPPAEFIDAVLNSKKS